MTNITFPAMTIDSLAIAIALDILANYDAHAEFIDLTESALSAHDAFDILESAITDDLSDIQHNANESDYLAFFDLDDSDANLEHLNLLLDSAELPTMIANLILANRAMNFNRFRAI